jgi:hypothetical protein
MFVMKWLLMGARRARSNSDLKIRPAQDITRSAHRRAGSKRMLTLLDHAAGLINRHTPIRGDFFKLLAGSIRPFN